MDDWHDWAYFGVILVQSAMLFYMSHWLTRMRKLLDQQSDALQESVVLMREGSDIIGTLQQQVIALGGEPYFPKQIPRRLMH